MLMLGSQFSVMDSLPPSGGSSTEGASAQGNMAAQQAQPQEAVASLTGSTPVVRATEFAPGHPCSAYSHAELRGNISESFSPYPQPAQTGDGARPYFLTATTLLGGWATSDQLSEWVLWHAIAGVDHFVLHVYMGSPAIKDVIRRLQEDQGISIDARFSEKDVWENNELVLDQTMNRFKTTAVELKGKSSWVAFLDIDEFVMPSSAAPGAGMSFAQWLASLTVSSPKVDHVYLRWVFYPVPLVARGTYFAAPAVFMHNFRFSDEKISKDGKEYRNTGKSVIRPEYFTGETNVHWFYPDDFMRYVPSERRLVPSTAAPAVLPVNCSLWENRLMMGMPAAVAMRRVRPANCPKCCLRGLDTFYLGHFRRRAPPRQGRFPNERDKDTPIMWPAKPEYGHQRTTAGKCGLVLELCRRIANFSSQELDLEACTFSAPS